MGRRTSVAIACLAVLLGGCVSNPQGPKLKQPYAVIKPVAPVHITNVDRVHALEYVNDYSTYSGPNWVKGDLRVLPGTHRVAVEFEDDTRYIGSDRALLEVREGLRYYVGVRHDRFYLFPEVVKVEPIEGYWEEHQR